MDATSSASLDAGLAFFDERVEAGADAAQISEGLFAVAELLDREPSLRRAFTDPASAPDGRRGLAQSLLGGQLDAASLEVLSELVARRWHSGVDLRTGIEQVATSAAMRAAEDAGVLDEVEDELFRFGRLLESEHALRRALTDPGLPQDRKLGLLDQLLQGKAQPTTLRLLELAVTRRRTGSLEHRIDELSRLAASRRQRYVAQVRVAAPLVAEHETRLASALARIYGRQVDLQVDVDPSVLGGVEVRVGDEVVNGTIVRRLDGARRRLAG